MAIWNKIKPSKLKRLYNEFKRCYVQLHGPCLVNHSAGGPKIGVLDKPVPMIRKSGFEFPNNVRFFAAPVHAKPKQEEKDHSGPRLNNEITAATVRLVSDDGHTIVSLREAIRQAMSLKLDLVEVQRAADPPVCKIMDYHREKYKKEITYKDRVKSKSEVSLRKGAIKEVRFSAKTEKKDLEMKADSVKRLMERGYRVKCMATGTEEQDLGGVLARLSALIEVISSGTQTRPYTSRLGIRSLVLESSESLRSAGFAFITWTNAWKALDAVGVADSLRPHHEQLRGVITASTISGLRTSETSFMNKGTTGDNEVRCMKRKLLLEALEKDLPNGTIRFSSKVVSIEDSDYFKLVHLADGTVIKTKVLIGCDGVNSVVAKHLGLSKPASVGRCGIRGYANFEAGHGFVDHKTLQFFGKGVRSGFIPCDETTVYWFMTFTPSVQDKEVEHDPAKMKEFVLNNLGKVPSQVKAVVELTQLENIMCSPLRFRHPWEMLVRNISKGNTCVAGDALHPMTPDIGQGGCSALEDAVVLARCLGEAFQKEKKHYFEGKEEDEMGEYKRIEMGLKKFAKERAWRSFELISTSYMVGFFQQSSWVFLTFLRDKVLASFMAGLLLRRASYDCGKLNAS